MISELKFLLPWIPVIALPAVLVLLGVWLYLRQTAQARALRRVVRKIASESQTELVIPDGMDGEIQLQHVLLTSMGILVMDLKRVDGNVFAGEKLEEWTVMAGPKRYKFQNPLPALRARTAAVQGLAKDVPVLGRVVFLGKAEFVGGRPEQAVTLQQLEEEFAEAARKGSESISAFHSSWQQIQLVASH